MKNIFQKLGSTFLVAALFAAQLNVNSTCSHYIHQEQVPDCAKKLSKIK